MAQQSIAGERCNSSLHFGATVTELDATDLAIVRLLIEDARRPYSDIAEAVDLSPPTVSDRIDRLLELGVIQRFTADVDRTTLSGGISILGELEVRPETVEATRDAIASIPVVEHVFVTADARIVFTATVIERDVRATLLERIDESAIVSLDVRVLVDESWNPQPPEVSLALTCDECGNTVTSEGESALLGDRRYHFCCPTCRARFEQRYDELSDAA